MKKDFNGKKKAITFSYDDGITQDIRLIELLDKYGLKCTFNLNSGLLGFSRMIEREGRMVSHDRIKREDVSRIYKNHEIAVHTLTHPLLTMLSDREITEQVEKDRLALSDIAGYEVTAMAYPGGGINHDERVARVVKENTGVKFARTITSSYSFAPQRDMYSFAPTVYQHGDGIKRVRELAERLFASEADEPQLLYIWGHSYELDIHDEWGELEELFKFISRRDDVFYGTNSEVLF